MVQLGDIFIYIDIFKKKLFSFIFGFGAAEVSFKANAQYKTLRRCRAPIAKSFFLIFVEQVHFCCSKLVNVEVMNACVAIV